MEIPLLRYSLPIWMAHMTNAGMPMFSQYISANLENQHVSGYDLPPKNCFLEIIKKLFGRSDHCLYTLVTGRKSLTF